MGVACAIAGAFAAGAPPAGARGFVLRRDGFEARTARVDARVDRDGTLSVGFHDGKRRAVELRTTRLGREASVALVDGGAALDPDGAVSVPRGDAVERMRVDGDGVEQSFAFAARPRGSGDLVVRVHVASGSPASAIPGGVRFASAPGAPSLAYDHAAWIDARGARTELAPAFDDGDIVLRVAADVVDHATYPAVLDPTLGAEIDITPKTPLPWQGANAVITCGTISCLVAWEDGTAGNAGIHAVHLDPSGGNADPIGFVIDDSTDAVFPNVAWDGQNYLVTWAQGTDSDSQALDTLVGEDPHAPAGVRIDAATTGAFGPSVARVADRFLAIWDEDNMTNGRIVSSDGSAGTFLVMPPINLVSGMAGNDHEVMLGWADGGGVWVQTFGKLGVAAASPTNLSPNPQASAPTLATSGSNYLVIWIDRSTNQLMGSITDGIVGGAPFPIADVDNTLFRAAFDGTQYWVALLEAPGSGFTSFRAIPVSVLGAVGAALPTVDLADGPTALAAACNGLGCLAVFPTGDRRVLRLGFGPHNDAAPSPLGSIATPVTSPALASNGTSYLAIYQDVVSKTYRAVELDADGATVSTPVWTAQGSQPRAAFDGTSFRVVWSSSATADEIARVPSLMMPGDALSVPSGDFAVTPTEPAIACSPTECMLVDGRPTISGVTFTDQLLHDVMIGPGTPPSVAFGHDVYMAAWTDSSRIHVATIGTNAQLGASLVLPSTSAAPPVIAFDGKDFVVAWAVVEDAVLYTARVSHAGELIDPPTLVMGANVATGDIAITAAGDGSTSILAWTDEAAKGDRICLVSFGGGKALGKPTCVAAGGDACDSPALAGGAPGRALLAYVRQDSRAAYQAPRVKVRTIDLGDLPGTACHDGALCSSSFCVDGYCCDAPCTDPCRTCSAEPGHCKAITAGQDPGSCEGDHFCRDGACVAPVGDSCDGDDQCATHHCEGPKGEGVCCSEECGSCQTCASGDCRPLPCSPYQCEDNACKETCASTVDCAEGFACDADGHCAAPPATPSSFADCAVSHDDDPREGPIQPLLVLGIAGGALWQRRARRRREAPK